MTRTNGNSQRKSRSTHSESVQSSVSPDLTTLAHLDQSIRGLTSVLVSRLENGERLGLSSYKGKRDYNKVLGYPTRVTLQHYQDLYDQDGLAERFVEVLPESAWTDEIFIQDEDDPEIDTEFEVQVNDLFSRLDLWNELFIADVLRSLAEYSVILIGVSGDNDFASPLQSISTLDDIIYLTSYHQSSASVLSSIRDKSSPLLGLPEFYQIKVSDTDTLKVHYTRIIHVAERRGMLFSRVKGRPVLKSVYRDFIDLWKVSKGGSEAAWNSMNRLSLLDADPGTPPPDARLLAKFEENFTKQLDTLQDEIEEARHGLKPYALTRGITPKTIAPSVFSFAADSEFIIKKIAAARGIPWRDLFGSELGQLASSQDVEKRRKTVTRYVDTFCRPLVRKIVDRFIELTDLRPKDDAYDVIWPKQDQFTEREKFDVIDRIAAANEKQVRAGEPPFILTNEVRDIVLEMESLEETEEDEDKDDSSEEETEEVTDNDDEDTNSEEEEDEDIASLSSHVSTSISTSTANHEWQVIHQIADRNAGLLTAWLSEFWDEIRDGIVLPQNRPLDEVVLGITDHISRVSSDLDDQLQSIISLSISKTADRIMQFNVDRGSWYSNNQPSNQRSLVEFEAVFNALNPRVLEYSINSSSTLITHLVQSQVELSRQIITKGFTDGIAPKKLQQTLRQHIGLRPDQYDAILSLENEIRSSSSGKLITRFPSLDGVRTQAGFRIKVPKTITPSWINRQLSRYSSMQLNLRNRTIGRTEMIRSSNFGQVELWKQNVEAGLLPKTIKRIWIDTGDERERPEHRQLAGQVTSLDKPFDNVGGGTIEPGQEVNCRCSQGIVE